jgi:N-acetylmuramoyl-L-alanine amidase
MTRLQRICALLGAASVAALGAAGVYGQTQAPPPASWIVLSKDGRQPLATTTAAGREMVALDELSRLFGLSVREDPVTRGLSVEVQGRSVVLSTSQGLASIGGRVVPLPAPPQRAGRTWLVPVEFIERALALAYPSKLDVRARAHLIVVGDLRVPRVRARLESFPTQARVTFEIVPVTPHTIVQEPGRIVVRFEADALDTELAPATAPDFVLALRQVAGSPAIAVDLGPRFATYRATASPPEGSLQRVTLDLAGAAPVTAPAAPTPAAPGPAPQQPQAAGQPPPPPAPDGPVPVIRSIVIDPGHGGEKEGAKGPSGALEKDVTLAVARMLKGAIEARLGIRVLLTRDDDRTLEPDERASYANNNKADLFVSLHANASVGRAAAGAEVFYLSLDGYSPEAQRLAMSEEGGAVPTMSGGDRQIEIILWEMAQMRHIADSAALAGLIEQALRSRVKMRTQAIQQAPFRVLVGANMPAVLVEMGFISNPAEEKLLTSPRYQQQVVDALVESIAKFRARLEEMQRSERGAATLPSPAIAPPPTVPPRVP